MLNELHELTAAFIRLAEIRGWRPDNLPMYEAQRRAFVFFTTLVPPVLLLIPAYKTGNVQLLQHIYYLLAAEFASHPRVPAYQKVSLSFLTMLQQLSNEPKLLEAFAAALSRCLDVAQETLVSVLSRLMPEVDVQNLEKARVREVALSFNNVYPEFHRLLRSLGIAEEPRAFRANMCAETRLPAAARQLATMRVLQELFADSAMEEKSADDIILACSNSDACSSYVFPICLGMTGGECGPPASRGSDLLWAPFAHSERSFCQHRTCLLHASARNLPDADKIPVAAVNTLARRSRLEHIKLPSIASRAPARRSAAAAAARSAPEIGGAQHQHARKRARYNASDTANDITTKEQAIAAVKSWKAFEVSHQDVDWRHGSAYQRCNCTAIGQALKQLPAPDRQCHRVVLCLSCGITFTSTFDARTIEERRSAGSSSELQQIVYVCGRHGCCGSCYRAAIAASTGGAAAASAAAAPDPSMPSPFPPFSGDFDIRDLCLIPGTQCQISAGAMEQALARVMEKRMSTVNKPPAAAAKAPSSAEAEGEDDDSGSESESSDEDEDDAEFEDDFKNES